MELLQLGNLVDIHMGSHEYSDYRGDQQVMVMTGDGELHRILSLSWDSANGHFVLCTENDVEGPHGD